MKTNRDFVEPEYLTDVARRNLAEFEANATESLAGYFPSEFVQDIEYKIKVDEDAGLITAANWRALNGATTSERYGGGEEKRGRLMPLARNYILDEEAILRQRAYGNAISSNAEEKANRAARSIAIQVNLKRRDALYDGKFTLKGSGGLRQLVDFGRNPEFTTTAPKLFTDETSHPLEYIETLVEQYEDVNGFRPEEIRMSSKVKRAIALNKQVIAEATASDMKARATDSEIAALLDDYDLPQIKVVGNSLVKEDDLDTGEEKVSKFLPEDVILLAPSSGDPTAPGSSKYGKTLWGTSASAELSDFRLKPEDLPGILVAINQDGWPASLEVIADAIAMPVVFNPNYTLKAKVI